MHDPMPIQLEPPGPHILPAVEEFLGILPAQGQLSIRIRLHLEGGLELQMPTTGRALTQLGAALAHRVYGHGVALLLAYATSPEKLSRHEMESLVIGMTRQKAIEFGNALARHASAPPASAQRREPPQPSRKRGFQPSAPPPLPRTPHKSHVKSARPPRSSWA
jgi:hypothetical protein